jgi:hypothetical protein
LKITTTIIATILSLYAISFLVYGTSAVKFTAYAQSYLQTIKYRNLVIDLGNEVETNAQLTYPAIGKGPFPGVLLIHGSGANDKNETLGFVHKNGPKPNTPFWQIAQCLSERGFAVLRYDKRGMPLPSSPPPPSLLLLVANTELKLGSRSPVTKAYVDPDVTRVNTKNMKAICLLVLKSR